MGLREVTEADAPPGWDYRVVNNQNQLGMGATSRYGPRPPSPDSVGPRGTPQWRAAFNAQRAWMQKQLHAGATLMDMGFAPEREHGIQAYYALQRGDFGGFRQDWYDSNKGSDRGYYDPVSGGYRSRGGGAGGAGFGGMGGMQPPQPPPGTGMASSGASTFAPTPSESSFAPSAPTTAPSPTFGFSESPSSGSSNLRDLFRRRGVKPSAMLIRRGK